MRMVFNGLNIGEDRPYIITGFKSSVLGQIKLNTYDIPQTSSVKFVSNYGKGIVMDVDMSILVDSHEQLLDRIRILQNALYPQPNTPIDMQIFTDNEAMYRVEAYLITDIDFERNISFGQVSFSLLVPSGIIRGDALQSQTLFEAGVATGAVLPWTLPILLGNVTGAGTVINMGNAISLATYTITGPGSNFTILNQTTNESISINGIALGNGQTIVINGTNQTVTQDGVSIYQFVTDDSIFPRLVPGANNIAFYVGAGSTTNTTLIINWYSTYVGI